MNGEKKNTTDARTTEERPTPRVIPVCQVCDTDGPVMSLQEYLRHGGGQCCGKPRGLLPPDEVLP